MGLGIGKYCHRCNNQLNYDDGFNFDETLCDECESITNYERKHEESL